ncbi:23S rRNA (pseudouridine1915-N3)-methyltransferase [Desulfonauticus submarinus]|uniref:Ribosomal RNA large subunit methyltransferase H n=1 Tax=Desulfonauticus submarinus TaxID=206665 RepID=A0A1H0A075_9BACT|nr:23S rRNA (pseudouridine(1915)-N(3))-methyltransferase RlmH [Desulfonauticus submarinus]SDN26990.1 23S rRNA (pseudouridine1915-N3)-methyltransferase [Desulfonauticus submarinus]
MKLTYNIKIIRVGKIKNKYFYNASKLYFDRIKNICNIKEIIIKEVKAKNFSTIINQEGKNIINKIDKKDFIILLDEKGKLFNSIEFSKVIDNICTQQKIPCFIIGGSYGNSQQIKNKADLLISLSPLTFCHELAYVVLLEQIYRSLTIIIGHPYHNE